MYSLLYYFLRTLLLYFERYAMITQQDLIAAGFKKFNQKNIWKFTETAWQKRFDDAKGKKYFITIAEYDNSMFPQLLEHRGQYTFTPETQFEANGVTFDVQMHSPKSIQEMLDFFESIWKNMSCDYYELYEGYQDENI